MNSFMLEAVNYAERKLAELAVDICDEFGTSSEQAHNIIYNALKDLDA